MLPRRFPEAKGARLSAPFATQPLVLVVGGETQLGRSLASALASYGFRTLQTPARASALTRAAGHEPDLVLLEVSHSNVDNVGLTAKLRDWTSVPIVVIVARSREGERAAILDAGANDCVMRPFQPSDLMSRVRVWLRRNVGINSQRVAPDAGADRLRIDRDRRTLSIDGREVHITPTECKLLLTLAHNSNRSMTEDQIVTAVWGAGTPTRAQYLRTHVRQLRHKLEKDPARPRYLVSEVGGGYRLKLS